MTLVDVGPWVLGAASFIGVVWNRLHISSLELKFDGVLVKWMKSEKKESFRDGQKDHEDKVGGGTL